MEIKCPICDDGKVGCPICSEVGFIEEHNDRKLCPHCKGSRYLVCSGCNGSGKIKESSK